MLWDLLPPDRPTMRTGATSGTDNETDQINGLDVTPLQIVDDLANAGDA